MFHFQYIVHVENVGRQKFASDAEMQSTVRQWLGQQPASFCIRHSELVDRWDEYLNEF